MCAIITDKLIFADKIKGVDDMIYEGKATLKNGRQCLMRSARAQDAAPLIEHLRVVAGETEYLVRYPDEVTMTLDGEREFLMAQQSGARTLMLCAFIDGELAGCGSFSPALDKSKCRHRATLGISVKRAYWGVGVGAALVSTLIDEAKAAGFERMELEVAASNERARALYKKFGFLECGAIPDGFKLRSGDYDDLIIMSRKI